MSFTYPRPSFVVAKVTEAQWEIMESERGSKQISQDVLLSRFVSQAGQDRKEGGATALEGCVEVEVSDVIPFIPANKREWPVRSGSVRAVKFNKVVL